MVYHQMTQKHVNRLGLDSIRGIWCAVRCKRPGRIIFSAIREIDVRNIGLWVGGSTFHGFLQRSGILP